MTDEIEFSQAKRDGVSLLIGLAGASGSGKTKSALELATGLAGPDGKVFGIDTEAGRMRHYAGEYSFVHGDLKPPFSPDRYLRAIDKAEHAGAAVIVIDSASHSWEGEGGLHDMHDAIVNEQIEAARKAHTGSWQFDEDKTRERLSVGAWREPKTLNKKFVSRLLQCRAHLILCFRADEKMRIEKVTDERGRTKTVIIQAKDLPPNERWTPICERRLPYELTLSLILTPQNPGYPVPVKLQDQHRAFLPLDKLVSADAGRQLAAWARGDAPAPATPGASPEAIAAAVAQCEAAAGFSTPAALEAAWKKLTAAERTAIGAAQLKVWKARIEANAKDE
jgi:hypothetical protein